LAYLVDLGFVHGFVGGCVVSGPLKVGQTVYDRNGRVYEFAGMMGESAVVRQVFDGLGWEGEIEPYPSDLASLMPLSQLADEPPTAQIVELVLRAENELKRLKNEIAEATSEARQAEKQNADRIAKLKRLSALSRIEDFIDGKITHFAIRTQYGSGVEVKAFDDVMLSKNDYGRFNGEVKLLSLYGTKKDYPQHGNMNGDLLWRVNQYYDGSGGGGLTVQPCLSEDEAKGIAAGWLEEKWEEHRGASDRIAHAHWLKDAIESAVKIGLNVPEDITADFEAQKSKAANDALAKAEAELEKARAAIASATSVERGTE
jgi:hypothetical protein